MGYQGISSNYNDSDLTENNIRDGVDIFGVEGNFEGLGGNYTIINPNQKPVTDQAIVDNLSYPVEKVLCVDEDTNYLYFVCILQYFYNFQQIRHHHVMLAKLNKATGTFEYFYDYGQLGGYGTDGGGVLTTKSDTTNIYIKVPGGNGGYYPNGGLLTITKATGSMSFTTDTTSDPGVTIGNSATYNGNTVSANAEGLIYDATGSGGGDFVLAMNGYIMGASGILSSSIGTISDSVSQTLPLGAGGDDYATSVGRRIFMHEGTNYLYLIVVIDGIYSASGGNDRKTVCIYILNKSTGKINIFSDVVVRFGGFTDIAIDDNTGNIELGDGVNADWYYNNSNNTFTTTNPGGTYTSQSWNTIAAWSSSSSPVFVSMDTITYDSKTYDIQFWEHEVGGSECVMFVRLVIS